MTLSKAKIKKINERYIHGVDKWSRMFASLASYLEEYKNDIIYIEVENTGKIRPSNFKTAEGIVKTWIKFNDELKQAKGWVVYFYTTNAPTGFVIGGNDLKNKDVIENVVKEMNVEEKLQLTDIFSGTLKSVKRKNAPSPTSPKNARSKKEKGVFEMKKPTQCILWKKPTLVRRGKTKDQFEVVKIYEDSSHLWRYLLKCRECGQLYFFEFYEVIDWEGGNDPQYTTYIPVETKKDVEKLKKSSPLELLQYFPQLRKDFPKGAKKPKVQWHGKQ